MTNHPVRWGILGAAQIARKNWQAIRNAGNATVVAVASRNLERSQRFIAECQSEVPFPISPVALGSYEALLASKEVDAVYIPLPTALRKEWVLRAAAVGKHIVCEKPCALSVADLQEMTNACRAHGVQFMDGVMFMHSRRLEGIRSVLDDGITVGDLKRIASGFSFCAGPDFYAENIRVHSGLEPHGCLGDLGWYCIRFALWAMKGRLPREVTGRILSQLGRADSPAPVPTEFSGELFFDGGVSLGFYCSFVTENQQWAHVSGTKGQLVVNDFVLPFFGSEAVFETNAPTYAMNGCRFNMEPHLRRWAIAEYSNNHPNAQETRLFRNFSAQVLTGQLNDEWPAIAFKTQQVMNACYQSALCHGQPVAI
ncbi:MAG: Gfo/Idh/MocA family oxidoreductase [Verrucomicrobiota bacterium]